MWLLIKRYNATCSIAKGVEPEFEQASGSSCQHAGSAGDRNKWTLLHVMHAVSKIQTMRNSGQMSQGFQQINCKEKIEGNQQMKWESKDLSSQKLKDKTKNYGL